MAEVENLSIVIDVIDSYSRELDQLLFKLGEVEIALQAVDDHTIDIDVRDGELDALLGKMAAAGFASGAFTPGDLLGGGGGGGGSGGGSGVADAASDLEDGFRLTALRMSDVHNALARIVPMLAVFIGALPAAVSGLVALAGAAVAAAGALGVLGAFAGMGAALERGGGDMMAGFEEMINEIQSDFMDAFRPLMEQLAPLFEDALDGLDKLFQRIANEGDAFLMLRDQARAFGGWVMDVLPSLLADISMFVDAVAPALGQVTDALSSIDIFGILAGVIADTLPLLMDMGALLGALLPHIYELSLGFLRVANAILLAANIFIDIITLGGLLDQQIGLLVGSLLAVWGATLLFNSSLFALAGKALFNAVTSILGAIQAFTSYNVVARLAAMSTWQMYAAVTALAGVLTLGIGAIIGIVGGLGTAFSNTSDQIDTATDSLRAFENQRNRMDRRGPNPYGNPQVERGQATGRSRYAGSSVQVNVEGDADDDTIRKQSNNAMYRMERGQR